MHESLNITFVAPLLSRVPWKLARHLFLVKWEGALFDLQYKITSDVRDHIRNFFGAESLMERYIRVPDMAAITARVT